MKNRFESGSYLKRETGSVGEWAVASLATIALLYFADPAFHRKARTAMNEPEFPQGIHEVYDRTANKFDFVYTGRQGEKCPENEIQKVVPIINKANEIRGVEVVCKPAAGAPAK